MRVEYVTGRFVIGGGAPDTVRNFPSVAVYDPEHNILVRRRQDSDVISGPPAEIYETLLGSEAHDEYERMWVGFAESGSGVQFQEVELPADFVGFANALYASRNPSEKIQDLLKSKA